MKRNRITAAILAAVCLLTIGYAALAAQAGSQGDPLVTLNYLVNIFRPQAVQAASQQAQGAVSDYQAAMLTRLSQSESALSGTMQQVNALMQSDSFVKRVAQAAGLDESQQQLQQNSTWQTLTLTGGQSLTAPLGTQLLLRAGSASAGMALQDLTTGGALAAGGALAPNHLYLAPSQGVCIKAGGAVTVLVRGAATVG